MLHRKLVVHATQVLCEVTKLLGDEDLEFALEKIIMGFIHDDKGLFLATSDSSHNRAHLTIQLLVCELVHLFQLVLELVIHRVELFLVEVVNLISLDLHLLETEKLSPPLTNRVQVAVIADPVSSNLSLKIAFKSSHGR